MDTANNPLLSDDLIPDFAALSAQHVGPAVALLIEETRKDFESLEGSLGATWDGLMVPLETVDDRLSRAWGAIGHMLGVRNSDKLREAHSACQADVVSLYTAMAQSRPVYDGMVALRDGDAWAGLDEGQRRVVDKAIRGAELAGVALDGADKERFTAIQLELAKLSTDFSNNVLDATKAWSMTLKEPAEVEGLPATALALAAAGARREGAEDATAEDGPWRISLDGPSVQSFLKHAKRRDLRKKLYLAYVQRASRGDTDNAPNIERILQLRQEKAALLGFDDYASLSTSRKMAGAVDRVQDLLEELLAASSEAGKREFDELNAFAAEHPEFGAVDADGLKHWDVGFWSERLREDRYDVDAEALRPYFPLPRVLEGLFALANRLFAVTIEAADGDAPIWHEDVRFFRIVDESGAQTAAFYLDPYSRPAEKRGGAWMDDCVGRSAAFETLRLPVAYLVCNGTPPVEDQPSLMTFREVETLFHEFGHGLQHMLTRVDDGHASGIRNIEWDAVELPSQFMENWCYDRPTFDAISGHWQTGEALPDEIFGKLNAARTFRAASGMLRQLTFGLTDIGIHHGFVPGGDRTVFDVQADVVKRTSVLPMLAEDRFLCGFLHIFAGGYAAGYYSYKWAEVLSADAFAAFEEAGLDDESAVAEVGRRFRDTVLARGGAEHPLAVFKAFRGREPSTEALLRHCGLRAA